MKSCGNPASSLWHVYIVECSDGTFYTGIAKDPAARVRQHNNGKGARYTRGRQPVTLVYREKVGEQGDALRREQQIKRLDPKGKRALIKSTPQL